MYGYLQTQTVTYRLEVTKRVSVTPWKGGSENHGEYWLPGHVLRLDRKLDWPWQRPKGALTYPFAESKEQISGLTNQYMPGPVEWRNIDTGSIDSREGSHQDCKESQ